MPPSSAGLELWGGLECSHVLVRGQVRDQLLETGHLARADDLERVAALGIRTLRYPLLWAHAARPDGALDFTAQAARFRRLRSLGIRPIAGFLHHGSGPGGLDPADPAFVEGLADYAEAVARRFPWIESYTPINEPVTTARFAHLYGHWHPHARDEAHFLRAVAGSALATAEAMARIRAVTPGARLVQTEDLGRIFATPRLADQAEYESERRFLGLDLLAGRVRPGHRFHRRLLDAGVPPRLLDRLADAPCPPDLIGIDQYLTSDRFLDHRPDRHPGTPVGGNGRQAYVDVAAVHIPDLLPELGLLPRLREVHARYGLPIAATEVHNGCTREEQLRWLLEAWRAGLAARAEGIAVEAVTVWSLFGTLDWASLLVGRLGHYESGAFDIRTDPPRITALGHAAAALCAGRDYAHPVVARPGWWRPDMPAATAPLHVTGPPAAIAAVLGCCAARRIAATTSRPERSPWGTLAVTEEAGVVRFNFRPRAGETLTVETSAEEDFVLAAHAVLDLAIDGEAGRLRIAELGPACQFRLVRDGVPAPGQAAATSARIVASSAGE